MRRVTTELLTFNVCFTGLLRNIEVRCTSSFNVCFDLSLTCLSLCLLVLFPSFNVCFGAFIAGVGREYLFLFQCLFHPSEFTDAVRKLAVVFQCLFRTGS
ncbi:MAG: hypothetical protein DRJ40_09570 [Thermoprotei archaeon]|nr:MAG: hypothetical protein DRJ40_09570 [Thermoprotei archaeon]